MARMSRMGRWGKEKRASGHTSPCASLIFRARGTATVMIYEVSKAARMFEARQAMGFNG